MDERLVAWGRAVKSRRRFTARMPPPLWLFTDAGRMADVVAAVSALPRGLCGVVFRHDGVPRRAALAHCVARVCRARRLVMVVAGAAVGLPGVARHRRGGSGFGHGTASAHGRPDVVRGLRSGAGVVFLSPVFATLSHVGQPALGPVRWATMARTRRHQVFGLGGIDGQSVRRLPRWTAGVGAIGALLG